MTPEIGPLRRAARLRALATCAALLLAGCPLGGTSEAPIKTCERPSQRCLLDGEKLGVCTPDAAGKLTCFSQH